MTSSNHEIWPHFSTFNDFAFKGLQRFRLGYLVVGEFLVFGLDLFESFGDVVWGVESSFPSEKFVDSLQNDQI